MKPNNKLLYVHRLRIHPSELLKNIPETNKRRTSISSTEQVFNEAMGPNQQALEDSGYDYKFKFDPQASQATRKSKNRKERSHGTQATFHDTAISRPTWERNSAHRRQMLS